MSSALNKNNDMGQDQVDRGDNQDQHNLRNDRHLQTGICSVEEIYYLRCCALARHWEFLLSFFFFFSIQKQKEKHCVLQNTEKRSFFFFLYIIITTLCEHKHIYSKVQECSAL